MNNLVYFLFKLSFLENIIESVINYQKKHPGWTDEELFQKARSIVIAEIQQITYNEYLPSLFGENSKYIPDCSAYDNSVYPKVYNTLAVAAFRFGHSGVTSHLNLLDENFEYLEEGILELRDAYFIPEFIDSVGIDPIIRGQMTTISEEIDTRMINDLRNFLFGVKKSGGLDLAALNTQRGRDHGIKDYNGVREFYGLAHKSFDDISSDQSIVDKLKLLYPDEDSIDLFVGGLAEDHLPGSSMGETFSVIMKHQFEKLCRGDRLFYKHKFNNAELKELENMTLSKIIELNTNVKTRSNIFFSE
eukprot:TRINITY_DN2511_c0_g1_i1.p1 TRINITY_DN2511_c0_g1~~TRINITY_DN2511_c0_g1_i1.p1  ORF type:complete len:303 (-),score=103.29 TRINITY_DN2511_c0_g1_i1:4-912(-)